MSFPTIHPAIKTLVLSLYIGPKPRYIAHHCTSWLVSNGFGFADFDGLPPGILTRCIVEVAQQRPMFRHFASQIPVKLAKKDTSLWSVIADRQLDVDTTLRDRTSHALILLWDEAVTQQRSRSASRHKPGVRDVSAAIERSEKRRMAWEAGMAHWRARQAAARHKPKPKKRSKPLSGKRLTRAKRKWVPGSQYVYGPRRHGKGKPKS